MFVTPTTSTQGTGYTPAAAEQIAKRAAHFGLLLTGGRGLKEKPLSSSLLYTLRNTPKKTTTNTHTRKREKNSACHSKCTHPKRGQQTFKKKKKTKVNTLEILLQVGRVIDANK